MSRFHWSWMVHRHLLNTKKVNQRDVNFGLLSHYDNYLDFILVFAMTSHRAIKAIVVHRLVLLCTVPLPPSAVQLLVDQPLTADLLAVLHELTQFETLQPRFSAMVPSCWTEIQQEQQQRKHPQHLHQKHGDASQHTRTWRLQADR